jgi:subtilase family serine protease
VFGAILFLSFANSAAAAVPDRIRGPVDTGRTRAVPFNIHPLAQPRFDRGAVDPAMPMDYILILFKPSSAQQADLDQLLADQQNPSSPLFHRWLTPEEFGNRFGLSASDHSKVVAWLASEGLTVNESGRARNWVAFSGTSAQVSKTLHTSLRRFRVDGETHFANSDDPAVPEALADVVGGFLGLNDFHPKPFAIPVSPEFNSGTNHYLVPEDFATIYNLTPLYQAGMDGTGQSIAVVGQSDISLSDIRSFRTRYNLPANDPKLVLFGSDPGGLGSSNNLEADLDLEWAGAIAPKATIYFVYSTSASNSLVQAVNQNVAPIVSVSYGSCEVNVSLPFYRSTTQQANAQGITILAASGDSGGAECDTQGSEPLATRGLSVQFPSVLR